MYLVFDLPEMSDDNPSPHTVAFWLHREFEQWHNKYQVPYKTKFHKNRLRLIMNSDSDYNFFLLSWNPDFNVSGYKVDQIWSKPSVIDPPKH